jgi:hypothetical protein
MPVLANPDNFCNDSKFLVGRRDDGNGSVNTLPWQSNHMTGTTDTKAKIEELLEAVFSIRSIQRLHKNSQLVSQPLSTIMTGSGHTKETGNRNATAVSKKCRRFQAGNWFPD